MILIIGTGLISEEYIKVLKSMKLNFEVVGNTKEKTNFISKKYLLKCYSGGIENFNFKKLYESIIIATPIKMLYNHLTFILKNCKSVKRILVEKPGCLYNIQLKDIINLKNKINKNCNIYIAYNRRFYSSLIKCKEIIKNNKIVNAYLEINEYNLKKIIKIFEKEILQNYFNCMTTHVIDMFFNIIGKPIILETKKEGINLLEWHSKSSIFSGKGLSDKDIPFEYYGNWNKDGKWKIKLLLDNDKILQFQPLEDLKIIDKGIETIINRDEIDIKHKPGFFNQVKSFLSNYDNLKTIEKQYEDCVNIYDNMSNYNKSYNIMIVGLGQIGFRHLQAILGTKLNINLFLVEINNENIIKCKKYLEDNEIKTFKFYNHINEINNVNFFDIVIISTCSNIRLKIIEDLSNNDTIKKIHNMVLEKIIFVNYDYFEKMEKLLYNKINLNNIYCSSDWYHRFNFNILSKKYDLSNSKFIITGKDWGLGCNSIHCIFSLLKIFDNFELDTKNIKIIDSKRIGFKEIKGTFFNDKIIMEDNDSFDYKLAIKIITKEHDIHILFENYNLLYKIYKNNELINDFIIEDQKVSQHYIDEYKNMIYKNKIKLIDYQTAKLGHKILLSKLSNIFGDKESLHIT